MIDRKQFTMRDILSWYMKGGEIFIESSDEIEWLINELNIITDCCFELGIELAELKGEPSPYWGT